MSKTIRRKDFGKKKNKMKPYTKPNKVKYETPSYEGYHSNGQLGGPTKEMKEEIRNANRSFKKGYRQELKRELKKELNETIETKTETVNHS